MKMNGRKKGSKESDEASRKREDIRACLDYLEPLATQAGLTEVAFWIGIARLAASHPPDRKGRFSVKHLLG